MDFSAYRAVIQRDNPGLEIVSFRAILDGWDSFVFEVNNACMFRFPRRPQVVANLRKEAHLLPALAAYLEPLSPVRIPVFEQVLLDEAVLEGSFVSYARIPGVPGEALQGCLERLAGDLGAFLGFVHAFEVPASLGHWIPPETPQDWRAKYQDLYQRLVLRAIPLLEPELGAAAARIYGDYLESDANFEFFPRLIHADLGAEHILCSSDGRLNGIIDWEDACMGDPALDFVGLYAQFGSDFVEWALRRYTLDLGSNFWQRMRFYKFVIPFHLIGFGLDTGDEKILAEGIDRLGEYVREHA